MRKGIELGYNGDGWQGGVSERKTNAMLAGAIGPCGIKRAYPGTHCSAQKIDGLVLGGHTR
jgi:hypothetical protein